MGLLHAGVGCEGQSEINGNSSAGTSPAPRCYSPPFTKFTASALHPENTLPGWRHASDFDPVDFIARLAASCLNPV